MATKHNITYPPVVAVRADEDVNVPRLTEGDIQSSILGLSGIFWALDMLIINGVADEVARKDAIANGVANLIIAGKLLTKEISARF